MKYKVIRTETADAQIRKIILYVAENFGTKVALKKLDDLEQDILDFGIHPLKGYSHGNRRCTDSENHFTCS